MTHTIKETRALSRTPANASVEQDDETIALTCAERAGDGLVVVHSNLEGGRDHPRFLVGVGVALRGEYLGSVTLVDEQVIALRDRLDEVLERAGDRQGRPEPSFYEAIVTDIEQSGLHEEYKAEAIEELTVLVDSGEYPRLTDPVGAYPGKQRLLVPFLWSGTPQGHGYWSKLCKALYEWKPGAEYGEPDED